MPATVTATALFADGDDADSADSADAADVENDGGDFAPVVMAEVVAAAANFSAVMVAAMAVLLLCLVTIDEAVRSLSSARAFVVDAHELSSGAWEAPRDRRHFCDPCSLRTK